MRILHVIDNLQADGAQRSTVLLAGASRARGHDVRVVALGRLEPALAGPDLPEGLVVETLPQPRMRQRVPALRALVRAWRPDIVHTTLWNADVVGRTVSMGTPAAVVSTFVAVPPWPWHSTTRRAAAFKWMADVVTAHARVDRFHALTGASAESNARALHLDRSHIGVVPRGRSDPQRTRRDPSCREAIRAELGVPPGGIVVLAVGRQDPVKGHRHLLHAVAEIRRDRPQVVACIAGRQGTATHELRAQRERLGLDGAVRLLGYRRDVPDLLHAADVFVLPSLAEGGMAVATEAFAAEVPVVLTSIEVLQDLVLPDVHAVMVPPGDAAALAAGLRRVIDDADGRRAQRVAAARRLFETHAELEGVAQQMDALYEQAVERRAARWTSRVGRRRARERFASGGPA